MAPPSKVDDVNEIIDYIRKHGSKKEGATLYVGKKQRHAIGLIPVEDLLISFDKDYNMSFAEWPVIGCLKDDHIHLAK